MQPPNACIFLVLVVLLILNPTLIHFFAELRGALAQRLSQPPPSVHRAHFLRESRAVAERAPGAAGVSPSDLYAAREAPRDVAAVQSGIVAAPSAAPAAAAAPAAPAEVAALLSTTAATCAVCGALPVPSPPSGPWAPRGNGSTLRAYIDLSLSDAIAGYMNFPTHAAFAVIARAQHDAGVVGAVGEIGVHHGRSFILAALLSTPAEPLWALDLFSTLQHLNLDGSGKGDENALAINMARVGLDIAKATTVAMSSLDLRADYFCASGIPRFRWFSVDGGHTEEATRRDMHAAACHLAEGGVIAVDDIFNNLFLGVTEGVFNFMSLNRARLAPFFMITGKIYFTTPSHHERYYAAARDFFVSRYGAYTDVTKTVIAGWHVVSHSVPVHADIVSRPEVAERVAQEFSEILGFPV